MSENPYENGLGTFRPPAQWQQSIEDYTRMRSAPRATWEPSLIEQRQLRAIMEKLATGGKMTKADRELMVQLATGGKMTKADRELIVRFMREAPEHAAHALAYMAFRKAELSTTDTARRD